MKLNKVLALALSGVMAVSMLAGCSGNGSNNGGSNSGEEQPPVADTTIAGAVNDKLDDDSVVAFTYSTEVEEAAKQIARVNGGLTQDIVDQWNEDDVKQLIENYLGIDDVVTLATLGSKQLTTVVGTQSAIAAKAYKDLTADGAKKKAAEDIAQWVNNVELENEKTDTASNLKYSFNYTGDIAMISADDEGHPVYVVIAIVECETAAPVIAE